MDQVRNSIDVLPRSEPDDQLRRAVYEAIYRRPALAEHAVRAVLPVHIVVKSGVVTLAGTVDSLEDGRLASQLAKSVPGVSQVLNELRTRE